MDEESQNYLTVQSIEAIGIINASHTLTHTHIYTRELLTTHATYICNFTNFVTFYVIRHILLSTESKL